MGSILATKPVYQIEKDVKFLRTDIIRFIKDNIGKIIDANPLSAHELNELLQHPTPHFVVDSKISSELNKLFENLWKDMQQPHVSYTDNQGYPLNINEIRDLFESERQTLIQAHTEKMLTHLHIEQVVTKIKQWRENQQQPNVTEINAEIQWDKIDFILPEIEAYLKGEAKLNTSDFEEILAEKQKHSFELAKAMDEFIRTDRDTLTNLSQFYQFWTDNELSEVKRPRSEDFSDSSSVESFETESAGSSVSLASPILREDEERAAIQKHPLIKYAPAFYQAFSIITDELKDYQTPKGLNGSRDKWTAQDDRMTRDNFDKFLSAKHTKMLKLRLAAATKNQIGSDSIDILSMSKNRGEFRESWLQKKLVVLVSSESEVLAARKQSESEVFTKLQKQVALSLPGRSDLIQRMHKATTKLFTENSAQHQSISKLLPEYTRALTKSNELTLQAMDHDAHLSTPSTDLTHAFDTVIPVLRIETNQKAYIKHIINKAMANPTSSWKLVTQQGAFTRMFSGGDVYTIKHNDLTYCRIIFKENAIDIVPGKTIWPMAGATNTAAYYKKENCLMVMRQIAERIQTEARAESPLRDRNKAEIKLFAIHSKRKTPPTGDKYTVERTSSSVEESIMRHASLGLDSMCEQAGKAFDALVGNLPGSLKDSSNKTHREVLAAVPSRFDNFSNKEALSPLYAFVELKDFVTQLNSVTEKLNDYFKQVQSLKDTALSAGKSYTTLKNLKVQLEECEYTKSRLSNVMYDLKDRLKPIHFKTKLEYKFDPEALDAPFRSARAAVKNYESEYKKEALALTDKLKTAQTEFTSVKDRVMFLERQMKAVAPQLVKADPNNPYDHDKIKLFDLEPGVVAETKPVAISKPQLQPQVSHSSPNVLQILGYVSLAVAAIFGIALVAKLTFGLALPLIGMIALQTQAPIAVGAGIFGGLSLFAGSRLAERKANSIPEVEMPLLAGAM